MVKAIGDNISMGEYNSLVYLLRKFKKIVRHEKINTILGTDIGTFNVSSGFINVGENFILENDVNIISQNCLPLSTYDFTFYIVNADTSETVLETPVTLSASTDEYGNLEITIPENLLSTGEEIRRDIKIEITFLEHEGVSPNRLLNLDLTTDKKYIRNGETATVTATLLDIDDEPLPGYTVYFNVNGVEISKITNDDGEAVLTFTGTGDTGVLNIKVLDKEINIIDYYFYDHAISTDYNPNYWGGYWEIARLQTSTIIRLCDKNASNFCPSAIPTQFDITKRLEFDTPYSMEFDIYYTTPNTNVYLRVWDGNTSPFTVYFNYPINKTGHYKLIVKEDVIQLWINNTLIEKQITVTDDTSVSFVSTKTDTEECKLLEFANLIIYNYETYEPPTHNYSLSLAGTSIIESGDSDTITATLLDNGVAVEGETLSYEIKKGSTVLDSGSGVTDGNGELDISYTGTGIGDVDVIVSGMSLQETFKVEDCIINDPLTSNSGKWTIPSSVSSNYSSDGWRISASSYAQIKLTDKLTSDCSVEFTISDYSTPIGSNPSTIVYTYTNGETTPNQSILENRSNSYIVLGTTINEPLPKNKPIRIEYTTSTLKLYVDNVLKGSINNTIGFPTRFEWHMGTGGRYAVYKDLKVKAL